MTSAFFSLFRALFGDFDIDAIMDNSSNYINVVLLMVYLFSAIFVLLSIFLTILGEHQQSVRDEQEAAKANGTSKPDYGVFSFLFGAVQLEVKRCLAQTKAKLMPNKFVRDRESSLTRRHQARASLNSALGMLQASSGSKTSPFGRRASLSERISVASSTSTCCSTEQASPEVGSVAVTALLDKQHVLLKHLLREQRGIKAEQVRQNCVACESCSA